MINTVSDSGSENSVDYEGDPIPQEAAHGKRKHRSLFREVLRSNIPE